MKNPSTGQPIIWWLGGAAVLALIAALYLFGLNRSAAEIPQVDLSLMEARVSTLIRSRISAVNTNPDSAGAWAELAQAFHAHDLFSQAIAAYAEAIKLSPEDVRWPYLAALAQAQSDPQASLALFRQAIDLKPSNAAVYINFGEVLVRLGQLDDADHAFSQALEIDANSSHALYGRAQVAILREEPETALALLERAEVLAPHRGEVHRMLAQVYQRLGNQDSARRQTMLAGAWPDSTRAPDPVAQAMESVAVDSQAIARRGVSLAKRGAFGEAEAAFREVLEIRPANARDYANLGGALAGQGKSEAALEAYRQGLEIEPENVDVLNNLGLSLMQTGRFEESELHFQKALEFDPEFAEALGNLGLLAERRGQPALAMDYLEQALEKSPGLIFARNALASQFARKGDTKAAAEHWRTALDINPNELTAIYYLAMVLASHGEHAESISLLRRGMAIAPNSSRLIAAMAWELATAPEDELRNGKEALQLAQRVFSALPNQPQMADVMAAALAETGDFDNAVKLMEKLVASGAGDAQALRLKVYRLQKPWRQSLPAEVRASSPKPKR